MKEELDLDRYFALRDRTLANNFAWLESFGCRIHRMGEIVQVTHPHFSDYNACVVLGFSSQTSILLDAILRERTRRGFIYVDEAVNDALGFHLTRSNYRLVFFSQVKVASRKHLNAPAQIELRQAKPGDLTYWSHLYSEGFGHSGNSATFDLERGQASYRDPAVQCWFLMERGHEIGVFQTCCHNQVIGLYSVALIPHYRTLARIIAAARTLRSQLPFNYSSNFYFERVVARVPSQQRLAPVLRCFMTIRRFMIYKRD